jgi:hypothetical protein
MANLSNINNKFLVTTGGNVLIGGTAVVGAAKLQVTGEARVYTGSNLGYWGVDAGNSYVYLGTNSSGYGLSLQTAGTERLTIDSSGNSTFTTGVTYHKIQTFFDGSYTSGFKFSDYNGGIWYDASLDDLTLNAGQANSQMLFQVAGSERMRIDSSGTLSIGPQALDIQIKASSNNSGKNLIYLRGNAIGDKAEISLNHYGSANMFIGMGTTAATVMSLTATSGGTDGIIINTSGNVGIGTNSPGRGLTIDRSNEYAAIEIIKNNTGNQIAYLGTGSSGATDNGILQLKHGGTNIVQLYTTGDSYLNGGNVGIGTTGPSAKLHSVVTTAGDSALKLQDDTGSVFDFQCGIAGITGDALVIKDTTLSYDYLTLRSGNVGIGYTSPGSQLSIYKTAFGGDTAGSGGTLDFGVGSTKYWQFRLDSSSSGDLAIDKTYANVWTTPITIQRSSGNVGIGTNSPLAKLDVQVTPGGAYQQWSYDSTGANNYHLQLNEYVTSGNVRFIFHQKNAGTTYAHALTFNQGNVIFGDLEIPTSAQLSGSAFKVDSKARRTLVQATNSTTLTDLQEYFNPNGAVGKIQTSGSATLFTTSSDYRLKEDLKSFSGLEVISKIPVYDFKWKISDERGYGVMAHELQEVLPQAVGGDKDYEKDHVVKEAKYDNDHNLIKEAEYGKRPSYQTVDYSKIVPLLVKAIQELKAEIELLKKK